MQFASPIQPAVAASVIAPGTVDLVGVKEAEDQCVEEGGWPEREAAHERAEEYDGFYG
jgi:hypothetical protein